MRGPTWLSVVGLALIPLAASCGSSSGTSGDGGSETGFPNHGEGGNSESGVDTGAHDTGAPDTVHAEAGCPSDVVPASITENLTLTLACSPWHVHAPVVQVGGTSTPVLTIEAGVTVLFDKGTYLLVGGAGGTDDAGTLAGGLQAVGTKALPITLTSSAATPKAGDWGNVWLQSATKPDSTMQYVNVEYAGAQVLPNTAAPADNGAIIVDSGDSGDGVGVLIQILLSNITVSSTGSSGIVFFGHQAGFAPSSGQITVNDWATGGYPIIIDGNDADTLPLTIITPASRTDAAVGIITEDSNIGGGAQTLIDHSLTWPPIPIPYAIDSTLFPDIGQCGLFIDGTGTTIATLTIAAPNTIKFGTPCGIYVDNQNIGQGLLIAQGTSSSNQVTFTSLKATPAAGDWGGIQFFASESTGQGGSTLDYCTMSYAAALASGEDPTAAIWVDMYLTDGTGPTIENCTFNDYVLATPPPPPVDGCCGIVASSTSNDTSYGSLTAGASGNTFNPGGTGSDVCYVGD
jgi:hypothetical protein